jgi:hypothetical protein
VSPYALLTGSILALLAAPLVWMACRVARDHAIAGGAFVVGIGLLMVSLRAHLGSRLVDITFAVLGVAAVTLLAATVTGSLSRRRDRSSPPTALPRARIVGDPERTRGRLLAR